MEETTEVLDLTNNMSTSFYQLSDGYTINIDSKSGHLLAGLYLVMNSKYHCYHIVHNIIFITTLSVKRNLSLLQGDTH